MAVLFVEIFRGIKEGADIFQTAHGRYVTAGRKNEILMAGATVHKPGCLFVDRRRGPVAELGGWVNISQNSNIFRNMFQQLFHVNTVAEVKHFGSNGNDGFYLLSCEVATIMIQKDKGVILQGIYK